MLSTNDIALWANERILPIIKGIKTYGIGKTAARDDKILPYADGKYIGIDDTYPAQSYHKELSVASSIVANSGYGDNERSLQNTTQMAMIVYFNEDKCSLTADKLYTFIQSAITGVLKADGYKSVRVNVLNAVLNDSAVWRQEYGDTPYKLAGPQRLIQVNYSITIVFDKHCIVIPNCVVAN